MKKDISALFENKNVSAVGRIISTAVGSLLIYNAFSGKKQPFKAALGGYLAFRGITGYCPIDKLLLPTGVGADIKIETSLTVNKPLEETYQFWRNLSNLPMFMKHLKRVAEVDKTKSVWEAAVPWKLGKLQWEAEITEEKENEFIAWQSLDGADIDNSGSVHFKDAGKFGTEVKVRINYAAPGGKPGELAAKLINPAFEEIIKEDVKNFRRYIETGEIPTTDGQPSNN